MKSSRKVLVWAVAAGAILWFGGELTLKPAQAQTAEGFDQRGNELVVDRLEHWQTWKMPTHLVRLDSSGTVQVRDFRSVYNLLEDRSFRRQVDISSDKPRVMNLDSTRSVDVKGNFKEDTAGSPVFDHFLRPGPSRAGSNLELAPNLLDGDPTTFWEPDRNRPMEDWWVEISLGRTVPVERLRLQYVNAELGDPFRRLLVFFEDAQFPLVEEDANFQFEVLEPLPGINEEQQEIVIDAAQTSGLLPPAGSGLVEKRLEQPKASLSWNGKLIETIRFQVTDTKKGRAEEMSESEYLALSVEARGDTEYLSKNETGRGEPVDSTTYFELPADRRGERRFFRRELPRLAEVDVWGWGDNVAFNMIEGGGRIIQQLPSGGGEQAFDGVLASFYQNNYWLEETPTENMMIADLGGTVWAKEFRVLSQGYFQSPSIRGYLLRGSAGERDSEGQLKFTRISSQEREINSSVGFFLELADILKPARQVRFFEFRALENDPGGTVTISRTPGIGEFMVFSEGPPAEVILTSGPLTVPDQSNLVSINWEAQTPPGTSVELKTRTGSEVERQIKYYNSGGGEVTAKKHRTLAFFLRGPIDTVFVPTADWSEWSEAYIRPGSEITSPSLRRFLQIEARLKAEAGVDPPSIKSVRVEYTDPSVVGLAGEIWPQEVVPGRRDTFAVFVSAAVVERPNPSPGFDELRLRSEPALDMELIDVALGTEGEFAAGAPYRLYANRVEEGLAAAAGDLLSVLSGRGDSLRIRFPEVLYQAMGNESNIFYRRVEEGEEVPTSEGGTLLDQVAYSRLPEQQQGAIRYFEKFKGANGDRLVEVDEQAFANLAPEARGPVRFFRKATSLTGETAFDERGDKLTAEAYESLPRSRQGKVVGQTRLVRLRFAAEVFLHGTRLKLAGRNATVGLPFQLGEGGEVTSLTPGSGLVVSALGADDLVRDMEIQPSPFTPNGDGINDVATIGFSLFRVFEPRPVTVRIATLAGREVKRFEQNLLGGRRWVQWDGRDAGGTLVPPGLYIVQVHGRADQQGLASTRRSRVVGVAY